ncbi:MAG: hypothetical protein NTU58_04025 [Candidatus Nealsonbacteria bacterium]|nr:hypothetical protein [Candidatus Nealsonbacteria bacterium]
MNDDLIKQLIEEIKKLNKTTKEASKNTNHLSSIIFIIAFVQLFIAYYQFLFSVIEGKHQLIGVGFFIAIVVTIWYIFHTLKGRSGN